MKAARLALFGIALCAATASFAQLSTEPPAELKKLDYLIGSWTGEGDFAVSGLELKVKVETTTSWDGQFIKQVSKMDFGMMVTTETMYIGWDPKKSEYTAYAFTNSAPTPRIERGKLGEDGKLVMTSDPWEIMGQAVASRATSWKKSDSEAGFILEMKMGEEWTKASEVTMKRKITW